MQRGLELIQQLREENGRLQAQVGDKSTERQIELQKLAVEQFRAQTERMKVAGEAVRGDYQQKGRGAPAGAPL